MSEPEYRTYRRMPNWGCLAVIIACILFWLLIIWAATSINTFLLS